jgi:Lon protease-like protein
MLKHGTSIPLFPLNVVLFPGMMLPLHIFEDRYKAMVTECLASDQIFGVVLAREKAAQTPNDANPLLEDIYSVGTTARITAMERLKEDRLNLITVGQERFLIKSISPSQNDFLVGSVDPFPMNDEHRLPQMGNLVDKLRVMVKEYIDHLADASGEDLSNATLPTDPAALAYLAGTAVQGPLQDKQDLLAAESLSTLVARTVSVIDRENQILAYMVRAHHAHQEIERLPFVDYSLN